MSAAVHHVALMRAPEIVVKYLTGDAPATGRFGYSGVFCSDLGLDEAFKASEPPAHDDWVPRSVADKEQRAIVNSALKQIKEVCRTVAGYSNRHRVDKSASEVPLGHFADMLAALMPTADGIGARRPSQPSRATVAVNRSAARRLPLRPETPREGSDAGQATTFSGLTAPGEWQPAMVPTPSAGRSSADWLEAMGRPTGQHVPPPETREIGDAVPAIEGAAAVLRYPFELRTNGNRVRLTARVEVMTTDGRQVEDEPPYGEADPEIFGWRDPSGTLHRRNEIETGPEGDGAWSVMVTLSTEAMMRVDVGVAVL